MLEVRNLVKQFQGDLTGVKQEVLKGINFKLNANDTVGFLGSNGAGKTTTIKVIMQFIKPTSGEIIWDKSLGTSWVHILKNIGYFPERAFLYPHLTGSELIEYMGRLQGLSKKDIKLDLAKRFNIFDALGKKIKEYSKGMMTRLGLVAALLHDPKIIILDEPLSGLDPIGRKEIKDYLLELNHLGKVIFFSSHIVSDVQEVCNKVLILKKGLVTVCESIDHLIKDVPYMVKTTGNLPNYSFKKEEDLFVYTIERNQKDELIKEAILKNQKIMEVSLAHKNLEDLIYETI